jgi:uncharacterized protein (TIGR00290 family)
MAKYKVWMSWSSGKDSAYALYQLRQSGQYHVAGLLSTLTENYDRVAMHATRRVLLERQAQVLDLPLQEVLIPYPCPNEIYADRMQRVLQEALSQGVTHIAFGDLFLEDIRKYREAQLAPLSIQPLFPLWGQVTTVLAQEMIAQGLKAVVTCVDPKQLDARFVGRQFDRAFLAELPPNVDPCAERGEFHTFCYAGPMFESPIPITLGEVVDRDGFVFQDVVLG